MDGDEHQHVVNTDQLREMIESRKQVKEAPRPWYSISEDFVIAIGTLISVTLVLIELAFNQ